MKPLELAGYVVQKCIDDSHPITNLQLQKILYFIQMQSIRQSEGKALIMPEAEFQAWRFGPVISEVYYAYCFHLSFPIDSIESIDMDNVPKTVPNYVDPIVIKSRQARAWDLVAISHRDGGAWKKIYIENKKITIPPQCIEEDALSIKNALFN
ncbi:Panacea domain-containing protein [Succinivibrio dextrinosolvens]|uniref:Panacea domain-containing protein n=1 Tax=Succinivibrio dextrinosolvens TaxID=83771 RepID=UPI000689D567|nr:type II toxin-antitoxin system antitoxin SocA domain-containing protein [Succinivibrio dextrinosolvens]